MENDKTDRKNITEKERHLLETNQDGPALKLETIAIGHHNIRLNVATWGSALGERIWPLAKVLCSYLYLRHDVMRGVASLLELGAGTGLVGILASRISHIPGRSVLLTDQDTRVKRLLHMNIAENFTDLADRPRCAHLKWGEGLDQFEATHGTFDLILGSDLLYTRCACLPLFQTVGKLLDKKPSSLFLLAHRERRTKLKRYIYQHSKICGLTCREIPLGDLPECLELTRKMDEVWYEANGAALCKPSCIFEFRWNLIGRNITEHTTI
ncbi:METTL21A [Branchiostoma lanceolatum]|nr:METTL21A [Branchiostoma lanceolatum]